jgi:hypothetical protein
MASALKSTVVRIVDGVGLMLGRAQRDRRPEVVAVSF